MTKGRILFYLVLAGIISVTAYLTYDLFFGTNDRSSKEASTTTTDKAPSAGPSALPDIEDDLNKQSQQRKKDIPAAPFANDPRVKGFSKLESKENLKEFAEVENELSVLLDLIDSGYRDDFLKKVDKLIAEKPQLRSFVALKGDFLIREERWEEAEKAIQELVRRDPENQAIKHKLSQVQAELGKVDASLGTLENVLESDPTNKKALSDYVTLSSVKGNSDAAWDRVQRALKVADNDPELLNIAGSIALQRKDYAQARQLADRSLAFGENEDALWIKHEIALANGDTQEIERTQRDIERFESAPASEKLRP